MKKTRITKREKERLRKVLSEMNFLRGEIASMKVENSLFKGMVEKYDRYSSILKEARKEHLYLFD